MFDLSNQPPIKTDYKSKFLEENFDKVLKEYKINFGSITLLEICKNNIDSKIIEYYYKYSSEDLTKKNHKEFLDCFFGLNKLIKKYPELKTKFPQFLRERGNISLKFLKHDDSIIDAFMENVERKVSSKTAQ